MKDKLRKVKDKVWENREEIVLGAAWTAAFGFTVWAFKAAMKQQAEAEAELLDAYASGKTVLPGPNGSYWIIETQE